MRKCICCGEIKHKSEFLRVVKTPTGEFLIDNTGKGKIAGRGAYICKSETCAAINSKRRRLDKPFKTNVPAEFYDEICKAVEDKN